MWFCRPAYQSLDILVGIISGEAGHGLLGKRKASQGRVKFGGGAFAEGPCPRESAGSARSESALTAPHWQFWNLCGISSTNRLSKSNMATPEAQEAAVKERIVNHMNKDHTDSVSYSAAVQDSISPPQIRRYLQAFKQKFFYQVRGARLIDVTLNDIKFTCGGQQVVMPFDPPMKTLKEARERLVQLDKDALKALGHSDITVTNYVPPWAPGQHYIHIINSAACLFTWIIFARKANFQSGSFVHDNLLSRFPSWSEFCLAIQPFLISIMFIIHAVEAVLMARKLSRHGLTPFDGIWWAWVGSAFNEGFTSFRRVNTHIEQKQKEKELKRH